MLQVQERASLDIVCQVFNFIDAMGGLEKLTTDSAEQFLAARAIIKSDKEKKKNRYLEKYSRKLQGYAEGGMPLNYQ